MEYFYDRTKLLLGEEAIDILSKKRVAVVGVGGVGSYACEALARSGVGSLLLIDIADVSPSNINRQVYALQSTIGREKAYLARERVLDINPDCNVQAYKTVVTESTLADIPINTCDFIIDAIDAPTSKMALIKYAKKHDIPIISSMGMGNKIDPTKLVITDIYKTSICPLARVMRRLCKEARIKRLKVIYSTEYPIRKEMPPASIIFVPATAGLLMAHEVVFSFLDL